MTTMRQYLVGEAPAALDDNHRDFMACTVQDLVMIGTAQGVSRHTSQGLKLATHGAGFINARTSFLEIMPPLATMATAGIRSAKQLARENMVDVSPPHCAPNNTTTNTPTGATNSCMGPRTLPGSMHNATTTTTTTAAAAAAAAAHLFTRHKHKVGVMTLQRSAVR
jgi:hypothetical protein